MSTPSWQFCTIKHFCSGPWNATPTCATNFLLSAKSGYEKKYQHIRFHKKFSLNWQAVANCSKTEASTWKVIFQTPKSNAIKVYQNKQKNRLKCMQKVTFFSASNQEKKLDNHIISRVVGFWLFPIYCCCWKKVFLELAQLKTSCLEVLRIHQFKHPSRMILSSLPTIKCSHRRTSTSKTTITYSLWND